MSDRLHVPPVYTEIPGDSPLIFLGGPIQGSPDWQSETALELIHHSANAHVATPRRKEKDAHFNYVEQVTWEKAHLKRSLELGVIMFWFAAQDHSLEYESGRAYGQTTRLEIGRAIGWHDTQPFPLVIGFDPNYTDHGGGSERYVREMAKESSIPVYDDLSDAIDQALLLSS